LKKSAEKTPAPTTGSEIAMRKALQEGEHRRQQYLETLHPRQREALDPKS